MNKEQYHLLKDQLRAGYSILVLALCILGVIDLFYIFLGFTDYDLIIFLIINLFVLSFSFAAVYFFNKDVYRDVKNKEVLHVKSIVLEKKERKDYEPGSGAMFIPVLGNLFPKLWGQKMKEIDRYEIVVKEKIAEVDRDLYDSIKVGDEVILSYAKYSKIFLGIKKG